jgi:hypothetical protein
MLHDVIDAKPLGGHRLALTFEDGVRGEIDVAALVPFEGVFAPLRSEAEFARVFVNRELGSVSWPCGADLDTQVLYANICPDYTEKHAPAAS